MQPWATHCPSLVITWETKGRDQRTSRALGNVQQGNSEYRKQLRYTEKHDLPTQHPPPHPRLRQVCSLGRGPRTAVIHMSTGSRCSFLGLCQLLVLVLLLTILSALVVISVWALSSQGGGAASPSSRGRIGPRALPEPCVPVTAQELRDTAEREALLLSPRRPLQGL